MTPYEIVHRVALACAKTRSNADENGDLDVAKMLVPRLYGDEHPLDLINVCDRVLRKGPEGVEPIDAFNVLAIARRQFGFDLIYFMRWKTELPSPMSVFETAAA